MRGMHAGRKNRWGWIAGVLALAVGFAAVDQVPCDSTTDTRIKEQIQAKLAGQVSLHPERLAIEVNDGIVRLTGSVASIGETMTVARLAGSISGVRSVANELTIRTQERPEVQITQEVTTLLQNRPKFRDGSIRVSVAGSEVTLSGVVKQTADRVDAEEIAGTARGVTNVINRIVVDNDARSPDAAIKSKVMSALGNPVSFGVVRNLEVEVLDGAVTIRGTVRRQSDRSMAERITLGIDGVVSVNNQVAVMSS